jgi:hypothetical protein
LSTVGDAVRWTTNTLEFSARCFYFAWEPGLRGPGYVARLLPWQWPDQVHGP